MAEETQEMTRISEMLARIGISQTSPSLTALDLAKSKADSYNATQGRLTGVDCPICRNRGDVMAYREDGTVYVRECECMKQRRSLSLMRKSGLGELLDRYTFASWQERKDWHRQMKYAAETFAKKAEGWFYVGGRPGTGKTHLCTAICSELMRRNMEVRYLVWRDFSVSAKAAVTEKAEYAAIVNPYKKCKVLYIDDFFKSARGASPSDGDVNLAVELINARYNDKSLITIISSEIKAETLLNIDEALGSRISERCGANCYDLSNCENWRLYADGNKH